MKKFSANFFNIFLVLIIFGSHSGCKKEPAKKTKQHAKVMKNGQNLVKKSLSAKPSANDKKNQGIAKKPAELQAGALSKKNPPMAQTKSLSRPPAAVQNQGKIKQIAAVQNVVQAKTLVAPPAQAKASNADENYEVYKEAAMDYAGGECDGSCESTGWKVKTSKGMLEISCYNYDCKGSGWSATGSDGQKLDCSCDGEDRCAVRAVHCV